MSVCAHLCTCVRVVRERAGKREGVCALAVSGDWDQRKGVGMCGSGLQALHGQLIPTHNMSHNTDDACYILGCRDFFSVTSVRRRVSTSESFAANGDPTS